jgi:hypothetical protein
MAPAGRRSRRVLRVALAMGAAVVPLALAGTGAMAAAKVTADGTAAGELAPGAPIRVRIQTNDSEGWQRIEAIEVALRLRGQPLDRVIVEPSTFSITVQNSDAPVLMGEEGVLRGPYFQVDNAKVTVTAKGNEFDMTFPLRLSAAPPPGAALFLTARDTTGISSGDVTLTPPVTTEDKGFPWGTIGLAVAAALFIGAFVGNTFSTRRSHSRTNVYSTVARRLDEERSKR